MTTKITKTKLKEIIKETVTEQVNSVYTVNGSSFDEDWEKKIIGPLKDAMKLLGQAKLGAKELKMLSFYDEIDDIQRSIWYLVKDEQ